jgi:hypothetical protein
MPYAITPMGSDVCAIHNLYAARDRPDQCHQRHRLRLFCVLGLTSAGSRHSQDAKRRTAGIFEERSRGDLIAVPGCAIVGKSFVRE